MGAGSHISHERTQPKRDNTHSYGERDLSLQEDDSRITPSHVQLGEK